AKHDPSTGGGADEFNPHFSPDGRKILFSSAGGGNFGLGPRPADGRGAPERLTANDAAELFPPWQPLVQASGPPLPASTAPAATNDAPLVGEIFSRGIELSEIRQAIFEARSRTSAARRAAFTRLLTSATQAERPLGAEQP